MRIFGSDRLQNIMRRLGMEEGVPIEHGMVSRSIERAQKQVEARNFETRKHLLEYDDVMNRQREEIYGMRRGILRGETAREHILTLAETILDYILGRHLDRGEERPGVGLRRVPTSTCRSISASKRRKLRLRRARRATRSARSSGRALLAVYDRRSRSSAPEMMRTHEKFVMLQVVDQQWKDHLLAIDHLKEGIGLRGYGQRDPLIEYKKESFELFTLMKERIEDQIVQYLFRLQPVPREEGEAAAARTARAAPRARRDAFAPRSGQRQLLLRRRGVGRSGRQGRDHPAPGAQGRPQRPVPLRLGQEVQEMPRSGGPSPVPGRLVAARTWPRREARSARARRPRPASEIPLALTFDDVLLLPGALRGAPARGRPAHEPDERDRR